MSKFKNIFLIIFILLLSGIKAFAFDAWINDARTLFLSNNVVIYGINIRTFNAKDTNKNGIIEEDLGEERGTFLNAIDRLDELASIGINTVHLLPVTPVGKTKALGTAGSLYAPSDFDKLNPQFKSPNSSLSLEDEMRKFVEECHRRKIRVIVELPSCGSYDLYLKHPEFFKKDKTQNPVIPMDWTDVRLLDAGSNDQINMDVYNLYNNFLELIINANADGILASEATLKPYSFWKKLITETRQRNPQFLFLAKASFSQKQAISEYATFTPCGKLLDAGFDGYYGNYSDLKNWTLARDLLANVKSDVEIYKKNSGTKSVVGNFATHDQISPVLVHGPQFSIMMIWLNATLPLNSYYIDGFSTGDNYIYPWANQKAPKTFTDDDYYFAHRGQMDIFNFSRKPNGNQYNIMAEIAMANKLRVLSKNVISGGDFVQLKTTSPSVFAYSRNYDGESVIVMGNLDFKKTQKAVVNVPTIKNTSYSIPIKINSVPEILNGKINTELSPGEVQVIYCPRLPDKQ